MNPYKQEREAAQADAWKAEALALLKAGKKVEAVKHCRNACRIGLRQALREIEALAARGA
jgi:ribosomal protein L7/L12